MAFPRCKGIQYSRGSRLNPDVGPINMRLYFAIAVLIAGIACGETIPTQQITNQYLTMTAPATWTLTIVAGKEGEMQMSLRIPSRIVPLFAYWDGLDPREWYSNNPLMHYSMSGRDYFIRQPQEEKEMWVIRTGPSYIIAAKVPFDLAPDDLTLLLNSVNTIEPK